MVQAVEHYGTSRAETDLARAKHPGRAATNIKNVDAVPRKCHPQYPPSGSMFERNSDRKLPGGVHV